MIYLTSMVNLMSLTQCIFGHNLRTRFFTSIQFLQNVKRTISTFILHHSLSFLGILPISIFSKKWGCHAQPYMGPLTLCQVWKKINEPILRKLCGKQADRQTLFHWNLLAMAGSLSTRKYLPKKLNRRVTLSVPKTIN